MKLAKFILDLAFYGVNTTFSYDRRCLYRVTLQYKSLRVIREFSYSYIDEMTLDISELLYLIIKERAEVLSDMLVSGDNDVDTINDGYNIKDMLED